MAWLDAIFGTTSAEKSESFKLAIELAEVLDDEDEDLKLHTQVCAKRFKALVILHKAQYDQSRSNRILGLTTIALLLLLKVITVDMLVTGLKAFL